MGQNACRGRRKNPTLGRVAAAVEQFCFCVHHRAFVACKTRFGQKRSPTVLPARDITGINRQAPLALGTDEDKKQRVKHHSPSCPNPVSSTDNKLARKKHTNTPPLIVLGQVGLSPFPFPFAAPHAPPPPPPPPPPEDDADSFELSVVWSRSNCCRRFTGREAGFGGKEGASARGGHGSRFGSRKCHGRPMQGNRAFGRCDLFQAVRCQSWYFRQNENQPDYNERVPCKSRKIRAAWIVPHPSELLSLDIFLLQCTTLHLSSTLA